MNEYGNCAKQVMNSIGDVTESIINIVKEFSN